MAKKIKKTTKKRKPDRLKAENIDERIVKLAEEGKSPAEIGIVLKEREGIPKAKLLGKDMKISKVLAEKGTKIQDDLADIKKKIKKIEEHLKKNKQDKVARRALIINLAKVRRIEKYKKKKKSKRK